MPTYPGDIPPTTPTPDFFSINPGVRKLVALLREHGFNTCDSGDGKTHDFACDREYPYVVCAVTPDTLVAEAHRLVEVLRAKGVQLAPLTVDGHTRGGDVQAYYGPLDGFAHVEVTGVTDNDLPER